MHIYFSGIGGTAIGPLALIAHQAGYQVSGSDKQDSQYIEYLRSHGITNIHIDQTTAGIQAVHQALPIDWVVYSSAVAIENPNHPELLFAQEQSIRHSKRDALLNQILTDSGKKLIAVAGTHGKTTTTAMVIWLFKQLGSPISYSVGAKMSFGDMGAFDPTSEYFVYECDEFDRNFLEFNPYLGIITGVDYDHHEIFPTRQDYEDAFRQFVSQSEHILGWQSDNHVLSNSDLLDDTDPQIEAIKLPGLVNRRDAWQVIQAVRTLTATPVDELVRHMELFPGLSRRFEKIAPHLYSDYAHTIPKIEGCLQMAKELSDQVVIVYEPLTNRRQYFIRHEYKHLFDGIKQLYWVPSYLAREDPHQAILSPSELITELDDVSIAKPAKLDANLKHAVQEHIQAGDTVVCISGGGGNSLDEWVRAEFS
jgi:UDP-N-acetylmuramate--alanine ligase